MEDATYQVNLPVQPPLLVIQTLQLLPPSFPPNLQPSRPLLHPPRAAKRAGFVQQQPDRQGWSEQADVFCYQGWRGERGGKELEDWVGEEGGEGQVWRRLSEEVRREAGPGGGVIGEEGGGAARSASARARRSD